MNTYESSSNHIVYVDAPEKYTASENRFALRIAVFNSVGFIYSTGSVTYLDARLTSHVFYSARTYPLGYWVCLLGPVIFILTYLCFKKSKTIYGKILYPALILIAAMLLSLPNFLPEFPHLGITSAAGLLAMTSIVASWIRFEPIAADYIKKPEIPWELKVERLKENITLWRTLAVGLTIGYIALIYPAFSFFGKGAAQMLTKRDEVFLVTSSWQLSFLLFSVYVLFGVIHEAIRKAELAGDLLLTIRKNGGK